MREIMRTVKRILFGVTEELAKTLPRGLKGKFVNDSFEINVPRWPDNDATRFIGWCVKNAVYDDWACGINL